MDQVDKHTTFICDEPDLYNGANGFDLPQILKPHSPVLLVGIQPNRHPAVVQVRITSKSMRE